MRHLKASETTFVRIYTLQSFRANKALKMDVYWLYVRYYNYPVM